MTTLNTYIMNDVKIESSVNSWIEAEYNLESTYLNDDNKLVVFCDRDLLQKEIDLIQFNYFEKLKQHSHSIFTGGF